MNRPDLTWGDVFDAVADAQEQPLTLAERVNYTFDLLAEAAAEAIESNRRRVIAEIFETA